MTAQFFTEVIVIIVLVLGLIVRVPCHVNKDFAANEGKA